MIEPAYKKYYYPVFVKGEFRGVLDQASVEVKCPQLLSKKVMKNWDVDLCFGKSKMKINKFGVNLPFSETGVPLVNIFDFTLEDLKKQWHKIPEHFKSAKDPPKVYRPTPIRRKAIWKDGRKIILENLPGGHAHVVHNVDFERETDEVQTEQ